MQQKLKQYITSLVLLATLTIPLGATQTTFAASACPKSPAQAGVNCITGSAVGGNCANLSKCDLFSKYINPLIAFLGALVGVAVVISIIVGGIQYGSSAGDPQKVSAAKNRIRNSIVALVTFLFLFALLNFLVPGGLR